MTDIAPLFRALADEKRIKIAAAIIDRALSLEAIAAATGLSVPLTARHLGHLETVGLVETAKRLEGTVYRFHQQPLLEALRAISQQPPAPSFGEDLAGYDQKVLATFFENGRLKSVPAQHKKREVILRYLAAQFETNRMYDEREVNAILRRYHDDVASLRRYLVDTDLLKRQVVRVVATEALLAGTPEVEYHLSYWRPGD